MNLGVSELEKFVPFSLNQTGIGSNTLFHQLFQEVTPLSAEDVGPCETAVTTAHTQVGDAPLDQMESRCQAPFPGSESLATGTANHSASLESKSEHERTKH